MQNAIDFLREASNGVIELSENAIKLILKEETLVERLQVLLKQNEPAYRMHTGTGPETAMNPHDGFGSSIAIDMKHEIDKYYKAVHNTTIDVLAAK